MYSGSLYPWGVQTVFMYHVFDLEKSLIWYETFTGVAHYRSLRRPSYSIVFNKGYIPNYEWTLYINKADYFQEILHGHARWRVRSLAELSDIIARMKKIGVQVSQEQKVKDIVDNYPLNWRKFDNGNTLALKVFGRRPHHASACGFVDPSGHIIIVRLEIQELNKDNIFVWR